MPERSEGSLNGSDMTENLLESDSYKSLEGTDRMVDLDARPSKLMLVARGSLLDMAAGEDGEGVYGNMSGLWIGYGFAEGKQKISETRQGALFISYKTKRHEEKVNLPCGFRTLFVLARPMEALGPQSYTLSRIMASPSFFYKEVPECSKHFDSLMYIYLQACDSKQRTRASWDWKS